MGAAEMTVSAPAAFSGAAYSRTAAVVSSGERVVALDQRHEPGQATDSTSAPASSARIELLVAAARDRRLRREQADPAVARRLHGRVGLGRDHADDGDAQLGLELRERRGGRRVAGDDDELHAPRLEEGADLARRTGVALERPRPVRRRAASPR